MPIPVKKLQNWFDEGGIFSFFQRHEVRQYKKSKTIEKQEKTLFSIETNITSNTFSTSNYWLRVHNQTC